MNPSVIEDLGVCARVCTECLTWEDLGVIIGPYDQSSIFRSFRFGISTPEVNDVDYNHLMMFQPSPTFPKVRYAETSSYGLGTKGFSRRFSESILSAMVAFLESLRRILSVMPSEKRQMQVEWQLLSSA